MPGEEAENDHNDGDDEKDVNQSPGDAEEQSQQPTSNEYPTD